MSLPSMTAFVYKGLVIYFLGSGRIFRQGYAACFRLSQQLIHVFDCCRTGPGMTKRLYYCGEYGNMFFEIVTNIHGAVYL